MYHTQEEELKIIEFVQQCETEVTIDTVRDFILKTFGTRWNTSDEQTVKYIQKFIKSKDKKRKLYK
jgi:hypothetical protein